MIKTAVYARYSSDNQRDASIDDQLRVCREYCKSKGLTIVAEYADRAISGKTDDRPEFQRMIKDGEHKVFSALVLYSLDRFSRNKYDSAIYKNRLKKAGITIAYVTTPVGEGPEAVLMESLLEGLSQYYSENLARNVKRGLEGNALKCLYTSGHIPLGYKVDDTKHYVVDPLTAPIVRRIYEEYASGMSKSLIIKRLNSEGIRTALGTPFTKNSFIGILRQEMYIGIYHWGDIRIEGGVPAIISKDLWDKAQKMKERFSKAKASAKAKENYMLTGKVFCGHCGAWMIGDSGRNHAGVQYLYYTCSHHKRNATSCPKKTERKHELEVLAARACRAALTDQNIEDISKRAAAMFAAQAASQDVTPIIKKKIAEATTKKNNLMIAIESGIITPTTKERLLALEAELTDLEEQLAKASAPKPTPSAEALAFWLNHFRSGELTDEEYQRNLIDTFLNSITLYDEPDGTKKAVLAFNLNSSTVTISGSDIDELVGLSTLYPNTYTVINENIFVTVIYIMPCA